MSKSLPFWQFFSFVFTGVAGTLFHFLYGWTGIGVTAIFSAVNESVFEHMKILFFPMFLFAFIESRFLTKRIQNYWCAKLIGILTGVFTIPAVYYTAIGAFNFTADWFNISIFFIAAAVAVLIETWLMKRECGCCLSAAKAKFFLFLLAFFFVSFSFHPPRFPLFVTP